MRELAVAGYVMLALVVVVCVERWFDRTDWFVVGTVGLLGAGRYLIKRQLADEPECPASRAGHPCIHLKDHPGSHRDEFGDYWND